MELHAIYRYVNIIEVVVSLHIFGLGNWDDKCRMQILLLECDRLQAHGHQYIYVGISKYEQMKKFCNIFARSKSKAIL